jgi:hypothetical protein
MFLNRVKKFKCFVYGNVVWLDSGENPELLIEMTPRANSKPICSGCELPGPGAMCESIFAPQEGRMPSE